LNHLLIFANWAVTFNFSQKNQRGSQHFVIFIPDDRFKGTLVIQINLKGRFALIFFKERLLPDLKGYFCFQDLKGTLFTIRFLNGDCWVI